MAKCPKCNSYVSESSFNKSFTWNCASCNATPLVVTVTSGLILWFIIAVLYKIVAYFFTYPLRTFVHSVYPLTLWFIWWRYIVRLKLVDKSKAKWYVLFFIIPAILTAIFAIILIMHIALSFPS